LKSKGAQVEASLPDLITLDISMPEKSVEFLLRKLIQSTSPKQERPKKRNQGKSEIYLPHLKKKGAKE